MRNAKEFLHRFVTANETWIHWYAPETKEESKPYTSAGEFAPKKAENLSDRKGDALRFLEFTRYDLGWLPEKTQTSQKALSSMANYWAGSTSNSKVNGFIWRGKSAVSPRVHTGSHLRRLKIKLVELSYELLTHRPHSLALLGQVYWAEYLSKRFCFFLLF